DRGAGNDLVVAMHHGFQRDAVAGTHAQHRRLRIVEPAPLGGFKRRRQEMEPLAIGQLNDSKVWVGWPDWWNCFGWRRCGRRRLSLRCWKRNNESAAGDHAGQRKCAE